MSGAVGLPMIQINLFFVFVLFFTSINDRNLVRSLSPALMVHAVKFVTAL